MRIALAAIAVAGCITTPKEPGPEGVQRSWKLRANASQPGPLNLPRLAYDSKRGHVILYGGSADLTTYAPTDAMYELDPSGWTQLCGPCTDGTGLATAGFTYDPFTDRLLLVDGFVGTVQDGNYQNVMWSYDFHAWTNLGALAGPTTRGFTQLVPDPTRGAVVLLGGYTTNSTKSDAWALDGTTGSSITDNRLANGPPPMVGGGQTAAFEPDRGRIVVLADDSQSNRDDIWTLTHDLSDPEHPDTWTQLCGSCTGTRRGGASLVYLPVYDQTFVIGGSQNTGDPVPAPRTWQINSDGTTAPLNDSTLPPRSSAGVVYDAGRDVVVLYGGNAASDDSCNHRACMETYELSRD